MKHIAYKLAMHWHKKYHAHSRYWYYFYAQFLIFNLTETAILFLISAVLGITFKTLLVLIGFTIVRTVRGNNHLNSYLRCIAFSTIHLILLSLISSVYNAFLAGLVFGYLIDTKLGTMYLKIFNKA
jgi:accessory gene regulator protein AgrB